MIVFFFSSRRRHTRCYRDWSSDVCSSDLISGTVATVALQGDSCLTLTVPGQPTYTLVPLQGTSFSIKGMSGYTVEFKRSPAGAVTEVVFYQPNGTFAAKRR